MILQLFILTDCLLRINFADGLVFQDMLPWHRELFGDGQFPDKDSHYLGQHLSSSTNDLMKLFRIEQKVAEALRKLQNSTSIDANFREIGEKYLDEVDFSQDTSPEQYATHPINAFHMMLRASKWLPSIKKHLNTTCLGLEIEVDIPMMPSVTDAKAGSAHGLADILEHYNQDVDELIRGRIIDPISGQVLESNRNLSSNEVLLIATEAKKMQCLEGHVFWLRGALKAAKAEGKSSAFQSKIKKLISAGILAHDDHLKNAKLRDVRNMQLKLADRTFKPNSVTPEVPNTEFRRALVDAHEKDENLFEKEYFKTLHFNAHLLFRTRIKNLCDGTHHRPAHLDKNLKCGFVNHGNPFFRLGPLKYERLSDEPEIAMFHQLVSEKQVDTMVDQAKGSLKATPYVISGEYVPYSKFRTSKVMYMNEFRYDISRIFSQSVQNATRFRLFGTDYDSENYQVMNYGIGGTISGHYDSEIFYSELGGTSEDVEYGGLRFVTFMFYLSDVILGGRTVFPHSGISVKPEKGSALYWFNTGPDYKTDSRINHLGCPVLVGNKWIANKWVKWLAQWRQHKCSKSHRHFSTQTPNGFTT